MSTKVTTEYLVDKWNKEGGIRGVPIKVVILDEGGGAKKQVTEFRRLVLEEKVDAVVGFTSSANCLAIAPVAEELKTLAVMHICGTHRLTEDMDLKYTFRTSNNQTSDSVILAKYVMKTQPNLKTVAGINDDYAWGRDSWGTFIDALQRLRSNAGLPPVEVKTTLWPKPLSGEYSAEMVTWSLLSSRQLPEGCSNRAPCCSAPENRFCRTLKASWGMASSHYPA
jgi:branched-chain amino acid transport system substrate-binding protein